LRVEHTPLHRAFRSSYSVLGAERDGEVGTRRESLCGDGKCRCALDLIRGSW